MFICDLLHNFSNKTMQEEYKNVTYICIPSTLLWYS